MSIGRVTVGSGPVGVMTVGVCFVVRAVAVVIAQRVVTTVDGSDDHAAHRTFDGMCPSALQGLAGLVGDGPTMSGPATPRTAGSR